MMSKNYQSLKGIDYLLLLVLFLSGFASSGALIQMANLWVSTDTYMHGMFVIPLVAMMAVQMDKPDFEAASLPLAQSLLIAGLWSISFLVANQSMINVLEQLVFVSIIPTVVLLKGGWKFLFHYRTPLLLCFLCIPFGDFLVPHLQSITSDMSVWMLRLVGVPVLHNGWYISIAAADFRVAEACSGINFLISTFVVSIFYMQKTHKRVVFISLGILVPLVANGLRVFLIIMVAHWGNVEAATGFDHLVYGWIFFVFVLLILFAIGHFWSDPAVEHENKVKYLDLIKKGDNRGVAVLLLFLVPAIIISGYLSGKSDKAQQEYDSKIKAENVVGIKDPLGAAFPYADKIDKAHEDGVFSIVATYITEKKGKKLIGYENQLFNKDVWSIKSSSVVSENGNNWERYVLVDLKGNTSVLYRRYVVDSSFIVGSISVKLAQTKSRLMGQDFGGKVEIYLVPEHMDSGKAPPL